MTINGYTDITGTDRAPTLNWGASGIDPNWVGSIWETKDGVQIISFKREFWKEVQQATEEMIMNQSQTLAGQVDTHVGKLQKDQLAYLKQNYNPRDMSKEEYDALLEDLVQLGVITEQEKRYLNFTNGWILQLSGSGIVPDTFMEPPFNFESCGGNVYELARFHSLVEWIPAYGYGHFQDAQALTFDKLLKVFNQMGVR